MDTAVGLFPVGPEEKDSQPHSVFSKMLPDTQPTQLALRVTQDQDQGKGSLPPSRSPAVLQPSRVTSDFAF